MSGERFGDLIFRFRETAEAVLGDKYLGGIEVLCNLLDNVNYVESSDSSWDTIMAASWYKQLHNFCKKLEDGKQDSRAIPPSPPIHYPRGKAHCQYCGATSEDWNKAFRFKR